MNTQLSENTLSEMKKAVGWIRFNAYTIFGLSLMAVIFVVMFLSNLPFVPNQEVIIGSVVLLVIIASFLGYFLLQYASGLKNAGETGSLSELERAFKNCKIFFIIWGVIAILGALNTIYSFTQLI